MNYKLFLSVLVFLLIFSECKKGPDDPLISLRSRKARVVGDWKLSSGKQVSSSSNVSSGGVNIHTSNETTTYDGSTYTTESDMTSGSTSIHDTETGPFTLKVSFKKDGSFEMEQMEDGEISSFKGTWNFLGKIGDTKNKEQIAIHLTSTSDPSNNSNTAFTGNQTDVVFNIRELRNKKMVLIVESGSVSTEAIGSSTDTDTYSSSTEFVFEQ